MEQPQFYQFDIETTAVTEVWRRGSVIESWLLDLTAAALVQSPDLDEYAGSVSDSGEGRWTSIAAIEEGVPAPVLTTALYPRFGSRDLDDFADKALSAMRKGFGGDEEKPTAARATTSRRRDTEPAVTRECGRPVGSLRAGGSHATAARCGPHLGVPAVLAV